MRLDDGWNQIQFNLSDFTRRAYGTNYIETLRVQVILSLIYRQFSMFCKLQVLENILFIMPELHSNVAGNFVF